MAATVNKKKTSPLPVKRSTPPAPAAKAPEAVRRPLPTDDDGAAPIAGPENLDKVRDILFGAQMRDSDRRFARLEERFAKEMADLREENRARLDSLETYVKKELQTMVDRLKAESTQRADAIKGVSQELKESSKAFGDQLKASDERAEESVRELRDEALAQSKALRDEIAKAVQDAHAATTSAADELREEKADRAALGDLFAEIGLRLTSDGSPSRRK